MNDTINEQLSATVDDEVDSTQQSLLIRRLGSDQEFRTRWGRYHLIGEALRSSPGDKFAGEGFAARVAAALSKEALPEFVGRRAWLRPVAGLAVAASVATVALLTLRVDVPPTVEDPTVVVPVTANPQLASGARFAAAPVVQWERARPEVQERLNRLLLDHADAAAAVDADEVPLEPEVRP